jgi:hypothetical protein
MIFIYRLLTVVISESNRTAVLSAGKALRSGIEQEVREIRLGWAGREEEIELLK